MTIIGSLQDGLTGDYKLIATKSALDCVASMGFAATMGWGVLLSAVSVLVVQGSITLGANAMSGFFTPPLIAQCSTAGGLLVVCIGINLAGIKKLPVADYLPQSCLHRCWQGWCRDYEGRPAITALPMGLPPSFMFKYPPGNTFAQPSCRLNTSGLTSPSR